MYTLGQKQQTEMLMSLRLSGSIMRCMEIFNIRFSDLKTSGVGRARHPQVRLCIMRGETNGVFCSQRKDVLVKAPYAMKEEIRWSFRESDKLGSQEAVHAHRVLRSFSKTRRTTSQIRYTNKSMMYHSLFTTHTNRDSDSPRSHRTNQNVENLGLK